jgi:transposase
LEGAYAGRGSDAYDPAMLLSLLIYGYATGTRSSRKIERVTCDSLAFRLIARDQHSDKTPCRTSAAASVRSLLRFSCRCC